MNNSNQAIKIWKNTSTLNGYDEGLQFTGNKIEADIALLGSKAINLEQFPNLKGIFRAGIGKDNVPEKEALKNQILVRYPSKETIDIIFDETAAFTCNLIFRMLYRSTGTLDPWHKADRYEISKKVLLIIGTGNIGKRVFKSMETVMCVKTFDLLDNKIEELQDLIPLADCISIHIPKTNENEAFFDKEKLGMMKDNSVIINTARAVIVDENALYAEISNGRLKAAFDVFWEEPYQGMLKEFYPNDFYMTPHIASTSIGFLEGCRKGLDELIKEINNA